MDTAENYAQCGKPFLDAIRRALWETDFGARVELMSEAKLVTLRVMRTAVATYWLPKVTA